MTNETFKRKRDSQYPYLDNLTSDLRQIGFPSCICPFAQHTSASRLEMLSRHIKQALIVNKPEFPYIFTGYETETGNYTYNESTRDCDAEVLAVVPKYNIHDIRGHSKFTIILRRDDGPIDYVDVERYTAGTEGFGYENDIIIPKPNTYLAKEDVLQKSRAHNGDEYMLGVNCNVAYMTMMETIEDAMMISETAADKLSSIEINKKTINVSIDMHPINMYGDDFDFKFIPDIGDTVGDDGILCAFRRLESDIFSAMASPDSLKYPQLQHDRVYYVPPNAQIIDMDFYVAKSKNTKPFPQSIYGQVEKYREGARIYWQKILDLYRQFSSQNIQFTPKFRTLVTAAMRRLYIENVRVPEMPHNANLQYVSKKNEPVRYLQIDVTYMARRSVNVGAKITDRYGAKGIVCRILKDEHMPTDEQGFRADVVIDPASVIKRMNTGQLYEQAINRTSELVRRRVQKEYEEDSMRAAHTLFKYYHDINPMYAKKVEAVKNTPKKAKDHVEHIIKNGIYLNIPPLLETMTTSLYQKLEAWGYIESPVTLTPYDNDGRPMETFKTHKSVCIGAKYIYILCKEPAPASPGVAHVSQHGIPIRPPKYDKGTFPIRQTPFKLGVDEFRFAIMNVKAEDFMRFVSLQANSLSGVSRTVETILSSDYPTRIKNVPISKEELIATNGPVSLLHTMMRTIGIDSQYTRVPENDDVMETQFPGVLGVDDTSDTT